jgi:osmoprotectant transport system permease protein
VGGSSLHCSDKGSMPVLIIEILRFITNPQNDFLGETQRYVVLCAVSIALAMAIGIPLAIIVSPQPVLAFIAVNLSGLGRAIPTIAFLAAALPYLGVGFKPAAVALTVLGIPPILLNTVAGLRGVDPAVIDAARGMGMTRVQILTRVQIPLILPVVAAGVRTSAVQIVATAPLAAIIGGGGYGDYILAGIDLLDTTQLLAGAIPVAILALLVEVALGATQRALTPSGLRVAEVHETALTVVKAGAEA